VERNTKIIDGRRISYLHGGRPDQPCLLLLHGWAMDAETLRPLGEELQANYYVLIPDLPGFGQSDPLPSPSFDSFANNMVEFIKSFGIVGRATLVGHSMGAGIAIQMAFDNPMVVEKLVLINGVGIPVQRSIAGWVGAALIKTARGFGENPSQAWQAVWTFHKNLRRPFWMIRTFWMVIHAFMMGEMDVIRGREVNTLVIYAPDDDFFKENALMGQIFETRPMVVQSSHDFPILRPTEAASLILSFI
jgi:pimeloyl-ACP methyl ester carboxylesterase